MAKQNFISVDSPVSAIPSLLSDRVKGFANSEEFIRHQQWKNVPGIVCGTLAIYISRIHRDGDPNGILDSAFSIIESLSSVGDGQIENLIVTEILENIHSNDYPELIERLGPESRALYDQWLV